MCIRSWIRRFSVVRSAPFVAVGIGQWPRCDIVLSSPMPRRSSPPYMLLSSLDHPGRGLYRLAAHMRRRARRPGIALSAALSRATKPAAAYRRGLKRRRPLRRARLIAYALDHYGHLQQERESVHTREQLLLPSGSLALNVNHILTRPRLTL